MRTLFLVFLVSLALPTPARAGAVEQAEAVRLSTELRDDVAEGHWKAADDHYRKLAALRGVELSIDDQLRGYQAAKALGDANAWYERLQAALALSPSPELMMDLARLLAWYGPVDLQVKPKLDPRPVLAMAELPFDPGQRRVFEAAAEAIQTEGHYAGLLPLGQFTLGSESFEVVGDTEAVVVRVKR